MTAMLRYRRTSRTAICVSPLVLISKLAADKFHRPAAVWGNDFTASRLGQGAFQIAVKAVYEATAKRELTTTTFGKPERGESTRYCEQSNVG